MTSEGLVEMFEGDSADTWSGKFPLMSIGGRAEGLACADLGARTPISMSRISFRLQQNYLSFAVVGLSLPTKSQTDNHRQSQKITDNHRHFKDPML